jgi:hypothetical protein
MTVVCKQEPQLYIANEILWAQRAMIDAVVKSALIDQTQAYIDMIIDHSQPQDINRDTVMNQLTAVKPSARELLDDALGYLHSEALRRFDAANHTAVVKSINYDDRGAVTDIEVDVTVS